MNRRALELAISTLILITLGILLLIALAYALTGGFKSFKASSDPFLETTQSTAIKQACSLACTNQDRIAFCCNLHEINDEEITCADERLETDCNLDCQNFSCN